MILFLFTVTFSVTVFGEEGVRGIVLLVEDYGMVME